MNYFRNLTLLVCLFLSTSIDASVRSTVFPREFRMFARQFVTACVVHYVGQSFTNALYRIYPQIERSFIAPCISLGQTSLSWNTTNRLHQQTTSVSYPGTHILAWLCATYTKKPADLITEYLLTDEHTWETLTNDEDIIPQIN